jgi:hypothetical protein
MGTQENSFPVVHVFVSIAIRKFIVTMTVIRFLMLREPSCAQVMTTKEYVMDLNKCGITLVGATRFANVPII